jgi:hypothetical protein
MPTATRTHKTYPCYVYAWCWLRDGRVVYININIQQDKCIMYYIPMSKNYNICTTANSTQHAAAAARYRHSALGTRAMGYAWLVHDQCTYTGHLFVGVGSWWNEEAPACHWDLHRHLPFVQALSTGIEQHPITIIRIRCV